MTLGSTLYYEKKMSYDEGIQVGEERGIQIGEEKTRKLMEELIELGVSPELIEKAKETIN